MLASDSEDEAVDDSEEDGHDEPIATKTAPPLQTPPSFPSEGPTIISTVPGRMVRSTIIQQDGLPNPILKDVLPPSRPDTPKKSVSFAPKSEVSDGAGSVSQVVTKKEDVHIEPTRTNSFAGFKRGFLTPSPDVVPTSSNAMVLSSRSPNAEPPGIPVIQVNGEQVPSTSTTATASAPRPAKKQSLFSQRKAQARAASEAASKPTVVKPPAKPPAMQSVVQERVPERVPEAPQMTKSPLSAATSTAGPSLPPTKKRESASDKVFKGRVLEKVPAEKITARAVESTPRTRSNAAASASHDDDSDQDMLEYSDNEDDAFDMDDAMLAREAALEYHTKRAEMGRRGLGGWTGGVREDGQVEWDRTVSIGHGVPVPVDGVSS